MTIVTVVCSPALQSADGAAAILRPRFPVAESGVFELRAETR